MLKFLNILWLYFNDRIFIHELRETIKILEIIVNISKKKTFFLTSITIKSNIKLITFQMSTHS